MRRLIRHTNSRYETTKTLYVTTIQVDRQQYNGGKEVRYRSTLGHRRSLLPLLPYVYIEAIEPHSIDRVLISFLTIGARTTDRQVCFKGELPHGIYLNKVPITFIKGSHFRGPKVFHFEMFQLDMLETSILARFNGCLPMAVFAPSRFLAPPIHLFDREVRTRAFGRRQ